MAAMTMTASFLGGSATAATTKHRPTTTSRRGMVVIKASKDSRSGEMVGEDKNSTRRDLMFAVAAAAACSVAKVAMADEPRRGTSEAKKKYAPICVTNPTARICRY